MIYAHSALLCYHYVIRYRYIIRYQWTQAIDSQIDSLTQNRRNSIALAMELRLFCTKPLWYLDSCSTDTQGHLIHIKGNDNIAPVSVK